LVRAGGRGFAFGLGFDFGFGLGFDFGFGLGFGCGRVGVGVGFSAGTDWTTGCGARTRSSRTTRGWRCADAVAANPMPVVAAMTAAIRPIEGVAPMATESARKLRATCECAHRARFPAICCRSNPQ
jgi:hypothetical protein